MIETKTTSPYTAHTVGFERLINGLGEHRLVVPSLSLSVQGRVPYPHYIRGLWIPADPGRVNLNRVLITRDRSEDVDDDWQDAIIRESPVDAAAFDALPRSDGLPRHVEFGNIFVLHPGHAVVLVVEQIGYPSVPPRLGGHLVLEPAPSILPWIATEPKPR